MGIFGRKKEKKFDKIEFKSPVDVRKVEPPIQTPTIQNMPLPKSQHFNRPISHSGESNVEKTLPATEFAPVFIKLTKYRQILNTMNGIKMSLNLIRNQLAILNELEKLRNENMKLLQSTFEKINEKLIKLDSQFMKPSGFMEDMPSMQMHEIESLESTLSDLKAQIEGLKQEVNALS